MAEVLKKRPDPVHYIIFGNGDIAQLLDAQERNVEEVVYFKFKPSAHMIFDNKISQEDYVRDGWIEKKYPLMHCRLLKKNVMNQVWELDVDFRGEVVKRHEAEIEKLKQDCMTLGTIVKSLKETIARLRFEFAEYAANPDALYKEMYYHLGQNKKLLSPEVIPAEPQNQEHGDN